MEVEVRGIPRELALRLKEKWGLRYFVETGTYKAETALWAAGQFEQVWSIEKWGPYYARCEERVKEYKNLTLIFGDSREWLGKVLSKLDGPALIWLDAHWTVDKAGREEDWPLEEELRAVSLSSGLLVEAGKSGHVVMVDDAHLFAGQVKDGWVEEGVIVVEPGGRKRRRNA